MAGHSKWDNIKHKKMKEDARRGKLFTKIARQITVAAREGGGDPNSNFRLRLAIEKAKAVNMPNDNVERSIKRGTGELAGENYEQILYEGYGPGGVAILVDALSDNRNRTASDMRYLFSKNGGSLGEAGCVGWMFHKKGRIVILSGDNEVNEDELMMLALEAGAEDVKNDEGSFEITTDPSDFESVKESLAEKYELESAEITMIPENLVRVDTEEAHKVLKLIDALEDSDDVQQVYTNLDLPDELVEEVG